jgi:glycosyltransferase involved in cell wall biosynthesis
MKVLYLSKYSSIGPSSRYRIYQYLPHLAEYNIDVDIRPLLKEGYFKIIEVENFTVKNLLKVFYAAYRYIIRFFDVLESNKYDLVVIEHQAFPYLPFFLEYFLRMLNKNIILEFDDAIYRTHPKKMPKLIKLSKAIIVGNNFLKDYAIKFNQNVKVVPTVIDMRRYVEMGQGSRVKGQGDLIICWIGLAYNIDYLKQLADVFRKLSDKIALKVISNKSIEIEGVNIIFKKWSNETEVEEIQSSHIGIMPLRDDEWSRGKCGLKLLQYMASGIPSVASPVGMNREIIQDGKNGFLCSTVDEWYEKLLRLCEDSELRKKVGFEGKKTIQDKYSINIWAPRLAEIYKTTASPSPLAGEGRGEG